MLILFFFILGIFEIACDGIIIWERKANNGFPEAKVLKQLVRNQAWPGRDLGHNDSTHDNAIIAAPDS